MNKEDEIEIKKEMNKEDEIEKLKKIIKIEKILIQKFDDNFYSKVTPQNFDEKLILILNCLNKNERETYNEERIIKDKIRFFTIFKLFDIGYYEKPKKLVDSNFSINNEFISTLNKKLENLENGIPDSNVLISKCEPPIIITIYLEEEIRKYLTKNYKKIIGNDNKIKKLNKLYKLYKDFKYIGFDFKENRWCINYDGKKNPLTSTKSESYVLDGVVVFPEIGKTSGLEVLNKINSILDK